MTRQPEIDLAVRPKYRTGQGHAPRSGKATPHQLASLTDSPRGESYQKREPSALSRNPTPKGGAVLLLIANPGRRRQPPTHSYNSRKFPNSFFPSVVRMLSGWNWTPTTGNKVCRTP